MSQRKSSIYIVLAIITFFLVIIPACQSVQCTRSPPDWIDNVPEEQIGRVYFVGISAEKVLQEKDSRDFALSNAVAKVARYIGQYVYTEINKISVFEGKASDFIDPEIIQNEVLIIISENIVRRAKEYKYYTEKCVEDSLFMGSKTTFKSYCLIHVPRDEISNAQRTTIENNKAVISEIESIANQLEDAQYNRYRDAFRAVQLVDGVVKSISLLISSHRPIVRSYENRLMQIREEALELRKELENDSAVVFEFTLIGLMAEFAKKPVKVCIAGIYDEDTGVAGALSIEIGNKTEESITKHPDVYILKKRQDVEEKLKANGFTWEDFINNSSILSEEVEVLLYVKYIIKREKVTIILELKQKSDSNVIAIKAIDLDKDFFPVLIEWEESKEKELNKLALTTTLSSVVPGSGQLINRRYVSGGIMLAIALGLSGTGTGLFISAMNDYQDHLETGSEIALWRSQIKFFSAASVMVAYGVEALISGIDNYRSNSALLSSLRK